MREFFSKYESGIILVLLTMLAAAMCVLLFVFVPEWLAKEKRAKEIAESMKCEYLGAAKNLENVRFINCNGDVRMIFLR